MRQFAFAELLERKRFTKLKEILDIELHNPHTSLLKYYIQYGWLFDQWSLTKKELTRKKYQQKAEKCFRRTLLIDSKNTRAINGLATVLLHQRRYIKALSVLHKGLKTARQRVTLYNSAGNVYRKLREYYKAEKHYKKGLRAKDTGIKTAALLNLIMLLRETKKSEREHYYRRKLQALAARSSIARAFLKQNKKQTGNNR